VLEKFIDQINRGEMHMSELNKAVFGVFQYNSQISHAKQKLLSEGFYNHDFEVLYPVAEMDDEVSPLKCTQIKLFGLIGALVGGAVFSIVAWLIVYGVIQHFPLQGSDDLLRQALTVALGFFVGMIYGAVSGVLVGIGTSRKPSHRYMDQINAGRILMSVTAKTNNKKDEAHKVLALTGAEDIGTNGEENCWSKVRHSMALREPHLIRDYNLMV
jgi:Protein of unknown function (DUF3341)